ncbi:FkbM family methyltransferase [Amycolatopsis sp., V23-08]|uniref:FkbM family methyltransferase n=1 Tax=Amycolatopsis heterodermiae TaxID=3110235 RepID=A0ABU5R7W2_9PSEU|nr:FkbM family methyltransferase [Amycolatopsis sp., V23-08]MEA5362327.1 FkbM family methyltransferase [Amycolatopsis sp., V23-08]
MTVPRPRLEVGPGAGSLRTRAALGLASCHARLTGGRVRVPVLKALDRLLPAGPLPRVRAHLAPGVDVELDPAGALARASVIAAGYEHGEVEAVADAVRPGGLFLDVGANIGWFTLMVATHRPAGEVWAFEPLPATADRLAANVRRAGRGNVRVVRAAAGHVGGEASFTSTMDDAFAHRASGDGPSVVCAVTTVDAEWDRAGQPRVDAVKVDVEGAEPDVLRGAEHVLHRDHPVLLVETPDAAAVAAVEAVLTPQGYRRRERAGLLPYNSLFRFAGTG